MPLRSHHDALPVRWVAPHRLTEVESTRIRPGISLVGKAGFEPAASASRTLRAAKLRHFPVGD